MTLLEDINTAGIAYGVLPRVPQMACATPAGTELKACTTSDDFPVVSGMVIAVKFTYANTYGDGSTTYPKLSINGTSYPVKLLTGTYAASGAWANGQTVLFMFDGTNFVKTA